MAELTFETLPPPGPDYLAWPRALAPRGALVVEHAHRSPGTDATRLRVHAEESQADVGLARDDA